MAVSQSFVDFVIGQLESIGPMTAKRMFGGVGLYAGDLFFAIVAADVLYIKADGTTREMMQRAGAHPFQPYPNRPGGKGSMQYYSVPVVVLEDGDALLQWATRSIAIARAQHTAKPLRHKKTRGTAKPCATSDLPR